MTHESVRNRTVPEYKLEPMGIGLILDRALRMVPSLFGILLVPFAVVSGIGVAITLPGVIENVALLTGLAIFNGLFSFWLMLVLMVISAVHWHGGKITIKEVSQKVTLSLALRFICLSLFIGLVTILGLLLFVIPGLVYSINRCLAPYILMVEGCSIGEALRKSKFLMTRERWYSLKGPYMRIGAIFIVVLVVAMLAGGINIGAQFLLTETVLARKVGAVVQFFGMMLQQFAQAFNCLCYVGLYYDLRARYEAADILSEIDNLAAS